MQHLLFVVAGRSKLYLEGQSPPRHLIDATYFHGSDLLYRELDASNRGRV